MLRAAIFCVVLAVGYGRVRYVKSDLVEAKLHISEQVAQTLVQEGWSRTPWGEYGAIFEKIMPTGGAFGSQRIRLVTDNQCRYLERIDGWGRVERDADMRCFPDDPQGAIAAALA